MSCIFNDYVWNPGAVHAARLVSDPEFSLDAVVSFDFERPREVVQTEDALVLADF